MSADAWADSEAAATAAGVEVRALSGDALAGATEVWRTVWDDPVMERHLLTALAHAGNYVAGAFVGDRIVGATAGFFGPPAAATMHSHVAGVVPGLANTGVGTAMKLHQRAWCLDRAVETMTWTFDPLVARNAAFNVRRLGATLDHYLVDFYGVMTDGVNAGQGSDRILVRWALGAPLPSVSRDPQPAPAILSVGEDLAPVVGAIPADASAVSLLVPSDIEGLRRDKPELAARWRIALRDAMLERWEAGWRPTAVGRDSRYLMEAL
jgi:predicted GNAT superfamily acetyltransferase